MIYVTPYYPETMSYTGPSTPSGFDTMEEVVEAMGPTPTSASPATIIYAEFGLIFSRIVRSIG